MAVPTQGSTPGKVTGGGHIPPAAEPTILAELLILSGSNPGGKATFGFVVQFENGGAKPTGNLEYHDHSSGDRIKATSYDLLEITDVSACPLGGKHAHFTGTADVNGVQETLIVDVDDCGEPGDADMFSIMAGSYVATGVLTGGNIQIHPAQ